MEKISFDSWQKLDLRIGKILSVERVPDTGKLYKLMVDIGLAQPIQILSGLVPFYPEDQLVGKSIAVVANLESKSFHGLESQGMLLAAGDQAILITPQSNVNPGTKAL